MEASYLKVDLLKNLIHNVILILVDYMFKLALISSCYILNIGTYLTSYCPAKFLIGTF